MFKKLNEKLSPENFEKFIPSLLILKNLFLDMTADRKKMLSAIYNYEHEEVNDQTKIAEWQKELATSEAELPGIQSAIANITDPTVRKRYEAKEHALGDKIERLKRNLGKNDSRSVFKETIAYSYHHEAIAAMDQWAESVGQWFETGALGEGQVTYNEKTYSYPKA